jgi:hypothetical protein
MQTNLSVQAFATQRNGQVELLIDFILVKFLKELASKGFISDYSEPYMQKRFSSDDCSDIFDHYLEFTPTKTNRKTQVWIQTTCYKGNDLGSPEPNKTYEIRETLIESLGLRRSLLENHEEFRTVHFTVGPIDYTYQWFIHAKNHAFDLSLYTGGVCGGENIFDVLANLLENVTAEFEVVQAIEKGMQDKSTGLSDFVSAIHEKLMEWFLNGMPKSDMADKQALLLESIKENSKKQLEESLSWSKQGGENIKGRAIKLLNGNEEDDPILIDTLKDLLDNKPFLKVAVDALSDWSEWATRHIPEPSNDNIDDYIKTLWTAEASAITRRLLIRMHTGQNVRYPADLYIQGISEHNLYGGNHNESQIDKITERLHERYAQLNIHNPVLLRDLLKGNRGKELLKESLRLESYNGTSLMPSFKYVELSLSPEFEFKTFADMKLPLPVAFHSRFSDSRVDPYTNLKVIVHKTSRKPVAIIKAKYFRKQEFPRRSKEESYVGFTTKYDYIDNKFVERYPGIPLIMFVDMDIELVPQEYAVTRLVTTGWNVFFSIDRLKEFLTSYASK